MKLKPLSSDFLSLAFEARGNPLAQGDAGLDPFFEALEAHGSEWLPEEIGGRKRKYSRAAILKALAGSGRKHSSPLITVCRASPLTMLNIAIYRHAMPSQFWVSAQIWPLTVAEEPARGEKWSRDLLHLVRAWASRYQVTHAYVHGGADVELSEFRKDRPQDRRPEEGPEQAPREWKRAIFWLNVLGKDWVDGLGRDRVLSTPAHLVEELPNGAVLLVTRPTISDWASEEARKAQARALCHLRPELNYDAVLGELLERSARLAPVEPRFDPDLAVLFQRVVDSVRATQRQQSIAELNGLRTEPVDEWLPAKAAHPSDEADAVAARSFYVDLADRLTVFLAPDVPTVFSGSPEALTTIDYRLYDEDFPGVFAREKLDRLLTPALGAYLGEVIVKHLGGRWIPRDNLDEAQVVVGDRAWLPFLRARRYMQSRRSLLEYSLTKFYREAERHRPPLGPRRN